MGGGGGGTSGDECTERERERERREGAGLSARSGQDATGQAGKSLSENQLLQRSSSASVFAHVLNSNVLMSSSPRVFCVLKTDLC